MQQLLAERKITIDLTDAALRWLGRVGYDSVYGGKAVEAGGCSGYLQGTRWRVDAARKAKACPMIALSRWQHRTRATLCPV